MLRFVTHFAKYSRNALYRYFVWFFYHMVGRLYFIILSCLDALKRHLFFIGFGCTVICTLWLLLNLSLLSIVTLFQSLIKWNLISIEIFCRGRQATIWNMGHIRHLKLDILIAGRELFEKKNLFNCIFFKFTFLISMKFYFII